MVFGKDNNLSRQTTYPLTRLSVVFTLVSVFEDSVLMQTFFLLSRVFMRPF